MHVQLWQMLLIIAYGFFINYDKNGTMIGTSQPVTAGLIVGLIMGERAGAAMRNFTEQS